MIYYANPTGEHVRDLMSAGIIGCITQPIQGNVTFPDDGWDVIADNGCFSAKWEHDHWFKWLLDKPRSMRFAVAPDVFDPTGAPCHEATLERWRYYGPLIERHGFTPAFVCQVGATPENIPDAPVYFLGGTTEWKLSHKAVAICEAAKARGAWIHMGRVNSKRRFKIARGMGCDSADGTILVFGPHENTLRVLDWLIDARYAPMLTEEPTHP